MNWLYYLGGANLYLIVFYIGYCLFLSKETHYTLNRIYLLSSCVFAFVLPLLQLGFLKPDMESATEMIDPNRYPDGPEAWQQNLLLFYICGACLFALLFFVKLFKLWVIIRESYISKLKEHKLIYIDEPNTAFSFFNYLFIAEETERVDFMTNHELVHIRQKHSADIIFTEILKVISWFNPVIYLVQRSLKNVHEFIADEQTASVNNNRLEYSAFLINNAYGLGGSSVTHSFFNNNLLKRRILMLNSERSGKLTRLKYLLMAPLFAGMLFISTVSFSKSYGWFDVAPVQQQLPPPPPPVKPVKNVTPPPNPPHQVITNGKPVTPAKPKNTDRVKFPPQVVRPGNAPKAINNKKPKVTDVVKFPPPVVKPGKAPKAINAKKPKVTDVVKFPPPAAKPVKAPKTIISKKPKVADVVKFPPPVVKPNSKRVIKFPPPVVVPNKLSGAKTTKRPPPPPPEPPAQHSDGTLDNN